MKEFVTILFQLEGFTLTTANKFSVKVSVRSYVVRKSKELSELRGKEYQAITLRQSLLLAII